jgi:membrane protease YdiL (CAAX protease family)
MTDIAISTALQAEDRVPSESRPVSTLPPCRPWAEIVRAVLYLVFAVWCVAILYVFLRLRIPGARAMGGATLSSTGSQVTGALMLALQIIVIGLAISRGRYLGGGDLVLGLAAGPIRRPWALAWVSIAQLGISCLIGAHFWMADGQQRQMIAVMADDPMYLIENVVSVVVLAPISEELFFRGWLWTALRRSWGVWPTALCTTVPWLALHGFDFVRLTKLLPLAVIICLVRHRIGTVRATIAIHAANNAMAMILTMVWFMFA